FKDNDPANRRSPLGVELLTLTPVKATDGELWDRVQAAKKEHLYRPSTDSESLGILAAEAGSPVVRLLQQYRFVSQICKNFVRPYTLKPGATEARAGTVDWEP